MRNIKIKNRPSSTIKLDLENLSLSKRLRLLRKALSKGTLNDITEVLDYVSPEEISGGTELKARILAKKIVDLGRMSFFEMRLIASFIGVDELILFKMAGNSLAKKRAVNKEGSSIVQKKKTGNAKDEFLQS